MLKREILLQRFNEDISGKNHVSGKRILENDLVSSININNEDGLIIIDGKVISESLFNEYSTNIEIDTESKMVLSTYCTCRDYEKKEFSKKNYCCKHLMATFYKALDDLSNNTALVGNTREKETIFKKENNILNILLENNEKEEIKMDVYLNKIEWKDTISAEFKIGLKSVSSNNLYVLKDIEQFLTAYYNNIPINYGKNFTLNFQKQCFSAKDKRIIEFIEILKNMDEPMKAFSKRRDKYIDGKYINIPSYLIRDFLERVKGHRVFLNEGFFYRPIESEILSIEPPLDFELKSLNKEYILTLKDGTPKTLSSNNDVFLFGTSIYLPEHEFCYKIGPYIQVFNESKSASMPKSEEDTILRRLIPDLQLLSRDIKLSKNIKNKIVMENVTFKFYFDRENEEVILNLKVKYGDYEFSIFNDCDEKVIYRDKKAEQNVKSVLRSLGFEAINEKFYLLYGDEFKFDFFKNKIHILQEIGEVYYSEKFKGIKHLGSNAIKGDIKNGKYNYFEMSFKIGDLDSQETAEILRAFRNNTKYYKLRSGEYIDLEEVELKTFLNLLNAISPDDINDNYIEVSKNRGIFLDNYMKENNIRYIKGKSQLKEIRDKFKNIEKLSFKEPENLNATLRSYQKVGYNWFKTLEYLNCGGILADEMGLGKTLQTISYIASNQGAISLVVVPTSLIYNWKCEFEKFAPNLKIGISNGVKDEREKLLNNIENYDVIITTYNLLKIDLEMYKNTEFKCCILDEAQYIKNSHCKNALAVKEIKSKTKFALTGTPIENSLMELWSIFDFIMPSYLYDEKRFSVRYHKKLKESPEVLDELNKLIKPFILRRYKKDVAHELPNKIEKNLIVSLGDEQEKVYASYAKYAVELIEKKVKDDEFKNSKIEILSYITKLRQLCLDPSIVMDNYMGESGKIEALIEILGEAIENNHKILVFSQFTSVLKNISKRLKKEKITFSYLDGSINSEKRMNMVKDFNEGANSVFLISLKAGGTGLNLTSADIVIHFDPWWNPAVEDQATDRAHRIGQKNVVEVIKMIAKGTIEEKIVNLQDEKRLLISKLIGQELSNGENLISLSEDELLDLFKIK